MDLGVQLSIQNFHSESNGSVPRKCTHTSAALWVSLFMSVGFYGENVIWMKEDLYPPLLWQKTLRALLTPGDSADGLSFRAPRDLNQHRKNSNLKRLQAPSSGSKHNVMANSLSAFLSY